MHALLFTLHARASYFVVVVPWRSLSCSCWDSGRSKKLHQSLICRLQAIGTALLHKVLIMNFPFTYQSSAPDCCCAQSSPSPSKMEYCQYRLSCAFFFFCLALYIVCVCVQLTQLVHAISEQIEYTLSTSVRRWLHVMRWGGIIIDTRTHTHTGSQCRCLW